jgi:hypothetical protein
LEAESEDEDSDETEDGAKDYDDVEDELPE